MYYILKWEVNGEKREEFFSEGDMFPEVSQYLASFERLSIEFTLEGKLGVLGVPEES